MTSVLFYVALGLCVLCTIVFALVALRRPVAPQKPKDELRLEGAGGLPDPNAAAETFAKAGPAATAAALSIFFMFVALVVSGVVELSVETSPEVETAKSE